MRVFIDAVLRFGLPKESKFFMCIIKPQNARSTGDILKKLTSEFAEEHLADFYGAKEEAQDEDFFPYVSTTLTSPTFLFQ